MMLAQSLTMMTYRDLRTDVSAAIKNILMPSVPRFDVQAA